MMFHTYNSPIHQVEKRVSEKKRKKDKTNEKNDMRMRDVLNEMYFCIIICIAVV